MSRDIVWGDFSIGVRVGPHFSVMTNPDPPLATTSKSELPAVFETPSYVRNVAGGSYRGGTLEDARTAVLGDLGLWIPQVPIEFMMDHILPPIHCNVNTVKSKLEGSGRIVGERWASFEKDPTKSASNENNSFNVLEGIFNDIIHHARGDIGGDDQGSGGEEDRKSVV